MLMKVPAPPEPQESRTAEPKVGKEDSAREARGLRYAEAVRSWARLALRRPGQHRPEQHSVVHREQRM